MKHLGEDPSSYKSIRQSRESRFYETHFIINNGLDNIACFFMLNDSNLKSTMDLNPEACLPAPLNLIRKSSHFNATTLDMGSSLTA